LSAVSVCFSVSVSVTLPLSGDADAAGKIANQIENSACAGCQNQQTSFGLSQKMRGLTEREREREGKIERERTPYQMS